MSFDNILPGTPGFLIVIAGGFALLVNVLAYVAFGLDKRQALEGGWRLPENNLLMLALFGGWPAAKLAQKRFRHKTRKQPFATLLNGIMLLWLLGSVALFFPESWLHDAHDYVEALVPATASGESAPVLPRRFGPGSD